MTCSTCGPSPNKIFCKASGSPENVVLVSDVGTSSTFDLFPNEFFCKESGKPEDVYVVSDLVTPHQMSAFVKHLVSPKMLFR